MKLTDADKGKRYFLDGNRTNEVTLIEVTYDDWVRIALSNNQLMSVTQNRLSPITELPLEKIISDKERADLEYPIKISKITMEYYDAEKGTTSIKWLEGDEAVKWNDWMRELCYKAEQVGMNPKWLSLKWLSKKKRAKA